MTCSATLHRLEPVRMQPCALQSDEPHFNSAGVKNFCTGVAWIARTEGAPRHCVLKAPALQ